MRVDSIRNGEIFLMNNNVYVVTHASYYLAQRTVTYCAIITTPTMGAHQMEPPSPKQAPGVNPFPSL